MKKPKKKSPAALGSDKPGLSGTDARLRAMREALAGATRQTINKSQAAYWLRAEVGMTWTAIASELGIKQPNACGMARRYAESNSFPWPIELRAGGRKPSGPIDHPTAPPPPKGTQYLFIAPAGYDQLELFARRNGLKSKHLRRLMARQDLVGRRNATIYVMRGELNREMKEALLQFGHPATNNLAVYLSEATCQGDKPWKPEP